MRFVVEVPDQEVFEAAERPEHLASEIAEIIANEVFCFSGLTMVVQNNPSSSAESSGLLILPREKLNAKSLE